MLFIRQENTDFVKTEGERYQILRGAKGDTHNKTNLREHEEIKKSCPLAGLLGGGEAWRTLQHSTGRGAAREADRSSCGRGRRSCTNTEAPEETGQAEGGRCDPSVTG